jgi:hypothetical protein
MQCEECIKEKMNERYQKDGADDKEFQSNCSCAREMRDAGRYDSPSGGRPYPF